MSFAPRLLNGRPDPAHPGAVRLGHPQLDAYLDLVSARARPNTLIATAYDLQVFFSVIGKEPIAVTPPDVLAFITPQRAPRRGPRVVRLEDGEPGLSARTIKRRLASISGFYEYLVLRGDVAANPVPRGLAVRRPGQRVLRGVPLIRTQRTLLRIIEPGDVNLLLAALRTQRDQAMVLAMLLGGLRRCEVLGLRFGDLQPGERRVLIADGERASSNVIHALMRPLALRNSETSLPTDGRIRRARGASSRKRSAPRSPSSSASHAIELPLAHDGGPARHQRIGRRRTAPDGHREHSCTCRARWSQQRHRSPCVPRLQAPAWKCARLPERAAPGAESAARPIGIAQPRDSTRCDSSA